MPAVSPRDRHRRHVGGVHAEGGEARVGALPRRPPADGNALGRAFATARSRSRCSRSRSARHRRPVRRQVLLPRRARGPPAAPRGIVPGGLAVSCSADRQALGKITADGVFLEPLETDPAQFLPEVTHDELEPRRRPDRPHPPDGEIREKLSRYPMKTRLSLNGPMVVARDIAHAKIKERLDAGEGMPQYLQDYCVYYAGPAKTPEATRRVRSARRRPAAWTPTSICSRRGGSFVMLAKGNRSKAVTDACKEHGGFYLGSIGGPAAVSRKTASRRSRCSNTPSSAWRRCGRSRCRLPRVHPRRRQGQRLLQRSVETPSRASNSRLSATALRPPP